MIVWILMFSRKPTLLWTQANFILLFKAIQTIRIWLTGGFSMASEAATELWIEQMPSAAKGNRIRLKALQNFW